MTLVLILFYVFMPALLLWLTSNFKLMSKVGPVILAYVFGIVLGNLFTLPDGFSRIQDELSGATVAIALPLLLFSMNVRAWVHSAGKAILSMLGATILVIGVAGLAVFLSKNGLDQAWQFGGMAIGLYTGGTPNLAAIKTALEVPATPFIMMHTYDAVNGIIYLVFVMSFGQKVFGMFLRPYPRSDNSLAGTPGTGVKSGKTPSWSAEDLKGLALGLGLSMVIVAISLGVSSFIPEGYATASIMLIITSLGIAASFSTRIRTIPHSFDFGMYIILIFSLVVGSMANLDQLANINWHMMFFVNFVVFGTMLLHALFCWIFKIDTDTFLITSVSAVCSPPFVPVVAKALNNREIILSGLTTGIIGYAIGNYLGILFAYIFRSLMY